jgi:pimeloyl-ACP methyl ester carboxylesterase
MTAGGEGTAMDYDSRGFATATDGTKLFYGVRGSGRDLVLLDGIGCDGWAWNRIQPHLAQRWRVVHMHYRGHGRSGAPVDPNANDVPTLADDALRVLDALGVEQAIPVGHSMGTQVALECYRREPGRFGALILICGSYGRITHTFHGNDLLDRALPTLIERVQRYRALARALWGRLPPAVSYRLARWLREIDGPAVRPEDFRQYVEHLSDIDLELYLTMLRKAGAHSAEDMLSEVRVPTLVIGAEKDTFTPAPIVRALAERIAGAQYVELPGASHAAPAERSQAILASVDGFLDGLTVPGR